MNKYELISEIEVVDLQILELKEGVESIKINLSQYFLENENKEGIDKAWVHRAKYAKMKKETEIGRLTIKKNKLNQMLKQVKKDEQDKKDMMEERIFIDIAKAMIDETVYNKIWDRVKRISRIGGN